MSLVSNQHFRKEIDAQLDADGAVVMSVHDTCRGERNMTAQPSERPMPRTRRPAFVEKRKPDFRD